MIEDESQSCSLEIEVLALRDGLEFNSLSVYKQAALVTLNMCG